MQHAFLQGGGEMGELIRAKDWSRTPLGALDTWPQSLRSAVSILLPSRAQIALFWGPELITLYNDAYRPVFGGKHPHALGQPIREAWAELWRDGLKQLFENVLATGEAFWARDRPFYMERHGYPEETFFDVSYDPVRDESGRVGGVFCIVSEVTGRVVGERRLKLLRDLAAVPAHAPGAEEAWALSASVLATAPRDVPFFDADPQDARAWPLGLHEAGSLAGLRWQPGPWPEPARRAMVLPLGEAGKIALGVSARLAPDEEYRAFLQLVAGQVSATLARASAAAAERRRAEALAELDRAKTAFFSNVSHEFRTPLTLMLGPVEELLAQRREAMPENARESLEMALRNGQRLLKLVNTLLDFARVEAGRAQASYEPLDLAALTADLASNFRSACERAGLELEVDCPPCAEPAYVDRELWEKIVLNLVSNAFKFTLQGKISVALRVENGFVLEVRDTGIGIPREELPRMFERFHRIEGARGRSHEGSGIGLALVNELVRLHGGVLSVDSEPGRGSAFTVSIPAGCGHLPADRVAAPRGLASTAVRAQAYVDEALSWLPATDEAARAAGRGQRILVVDDNADLRAYARRVLSERYEVELAEDGETALAALRARPPDLVVADVMMPRLDGFGLIRELRADPELRALPVILVSARAGEEARLDGLNRGADDYLVKPFSARELQVRVAALLQSARVRREAEQALRASTARLATLLNLMPAAVYTCEAPSGVITFYNGQAAMLWGRAPAPGDRDERFCGSFRLWRTDGTPLPHGETPMAVALAEGRSFRNEEVVIERPDGSRVTVLVSIDPLRDEGGRVTGAINVFHDISERKRMLEALEESEARFRAVVESQSEMLCRFRPDGTILFVNPAYARALGTTPDAMAKRSFWDFIAEADRPGVRAMLERLTPEAPEARIENRFETAAGARWTLWTNRALAFDAEGRLLEAQASGIDITDRKRAEIELRARVRQQHEVAKLGELALRERDLQKLFDRACAVVAETLQVEYCAVLELLPGERELLLRAGVGWNEGLVGAARIATGANSQAAYTLAVDAAVVVRDLREETRFRPPMLLEHGVVSGMSCVIRGADGRRWGVIGTHARRRIEFTGDDISFLTTVAGLLSHAIHRERVEAALRESDRRKDEFLAVLSHELRNPLAPIRNAVSLLEDGEDDPQLRAQARAILGRQVAHMIRLVDELLDLTRISRGHVGLRMRPVALADVFAAAVETSRPLIDAGRHALEVRLPEPPVWLFADAVRLAQVLSNLLNNAAKYTPRGGRIELAARADGEGVAISVRDNGDGIDPAELPALFEMFTQSQATRRRAPGGLGIGLALAKQLVELHDGTLEGRSDGPGRGAEFTVRMPALASPRAASAEREAVGEWNAP